MWPAAIALMSCGALVLAGRQYRYKAMILAACLALVLSSAGLILSLTTTDLERVSTMLTGVATGVLVIFFVGAFVAAPTTRPRRPGTR